MHDRHKFSLDQIAFIAGSQTPIMPCHLIERVPGQRLELSFSASCSISNQYNGLKTDCGEEGIEPVVDESSPWSRAPKTVGRVSGTTACAGPTSPGPFRFGKRARCIVYLKDHFES